MTMAKHRQINIRGQQGSKHVTEAERAAIDAYAGPVQKIPMGKSAFQVNDVWDGLRLVTIFDDCATEYGTPPSHVRGRKQVAQCRELQARGMTSQEIGAEMKIARVRVLQLLRRVAVEAAQ